jgi:hypothetical protein
MTGRRVQKCERIMKVLGILGLVAVTAALADGALTCKLGGIDVPGFAVTSLPEARFKALHAAVTPSGPAERWTEIPWQTDLQAARQKAAREGKPILMWIMDGHPLGCT